MPELAAPTDLRFEHHPADRPVLGIGTATPRLSWQVPAAPAGWAQTRYEIEISRGGARSVHGGAPSAPGAAPSVHGAAPSVHGAASGEQILVAWPGDPLQAREQASVRVRVGDATSWSEWSAPGVVEAGLLAATDWTARLISPRGLAAIGDPAPILAGSLEVPGDIVMARLYATAHGLYVASLNGRRVGDERLAPGWTAYQHRLRHQTYDVTDLVTSGTNRLEILLGNGWFRGRLGFQGRHAVYGDRLAALAQLEVTTADGVVHVLGTDGSWTARESRIVADDLYDGQRTDLRIADGFLAAQDTSSARYSPSEILAAQDTSSASISPSEILPQQDTRPASISAGEYLAQRDTRSASISLSATSPAAPNPAAPNPAAPNPAAPNPAAPSPGATSAVDVLDADLALLVAPDGPPVRITEVVPAVSVTTSPSGKQLIDFGQNLVGWVRLRVRGAAPGDEIVVRHAEVLEDGELGVRPLRTAKATDSYVLAGPAEVTLEPELTFHGFRYAEVTGVAIQRPDIEAVVVGSDLRRTGWFESDHALLNRFHENVVWGMRGNFVDVPTDCPQRDERLGWTGDIQVFSPTASFLFDTAGFLGNWLADLAAEQQKDGSVPYVIPDVIRRPGPATAAWGDAATIVPWVLYQRTGDRDLLKRQLPSMRGWVDKMAALAGPGLLWAGGFQFGDWLDPTAPPADPFRAKALPDVIATAHLARSAEIVSLAAEVAGDPGTAREYGELAARVRQAFAREYVTPGGRVLGDAATTYALALRWALLPDAAQRAHAGERLADLVRAAGFRISTGFVGTPLITDALADAGHAGLAYRLLLQTGCPSWLYSVTMGATTVWERWDSMLPDGRINPGEMTSFNHYALGAVADWLHRRVAGLAPGAPGYRVIDVRPLPDAHLTRAAARHLTPYGEASVAWERSDGELRLTVVVPVGAAAVVRVPGQDQDLDVRHGRHEWRVPDPYAQAVEMPAEPTIRQLMDHAPSWDRLVAAAVESGVAADEASLADRLERFFDAPAATVVDAATADGFVPGADRMRALYSPGGN